VKNTFLPFAVAAIAFAATFQPQVTEAQIPPGNSAAAAPAATLLSPEQLQELVGRVALYPDDLLALVLPASTTPLDIVKGQRFLTGYEKNKELKPDPSISEPVINLLTYPEVVTLMSNDLDWTEALGQAVMAQQPDVLQAVQTFRRQAQTAGNLKTDEKQTVIVQEDVVQIAPSNPEVVYVPQYEPSTVVVQQAAPVVTYAPTAYPSYYHPVASAATGFVAGAATAYGLNWASGSVYYGAGPVQAEYWQDQRHDYANEAREDWQDYGKGQQEDWQEHANKSQEQRQKAALVNQNQKQRAAKRESEAEVRMPPRDNQGQECGGSAGRSAEAHRAGRCTDLAGSRAERAHRRIRRQPARDGPRAPAHRACRRSQTGVGKPGAINPARRRQSGSCEQAGGIDAIWRRIGGGGGQFRDCFQRSRFGR
jgi:hypothetical protein